MTHPKNKPQNKPQKKPQHSIKRSVPVVPPAGAEKSANALAKISARQPWGLWLLAGLYAVSGFLILPRFDICFNDDWVFTWITKRFLDTGTFVSTGFEAMYFSIQGVLGAATCLLTGGFSLFGIHLSTFILSFAAAVAFYFFLRDLGNDEPRSTAGALLLACNPIFFLNSFNYMTDVPAFAFVMLSIFFFSRGILRRRDGLIFCGSCLAVLGIFIRQFCIFVSAAFILWVLFNPVERRRLSARRVVFLFALPHAAGGFFWYWWTLSHKIGRLPYSIDLEKLALNYLYIFLTLGFFVTPLLVAFFLATWFRRKASGMMLFWILAAGFGMFLCYKEKLFPFLRNQITAWGVYEPAEFIQGEPARLFPNALLILLTILSVAATAFLGAWLISRLTTMVEDWRSRARAGRFNLSWHGFTGLQVTDPKHFLCFFSLMYLAALVLLTYPFDRYLLFLIPVSVVFALDATRQLRFSVRLTTIALSAYLLFAAFIAIDALSWNRAVWEEARNLVGTGVLAREIDGGWAWDGYSYLSGPAVPAERLKRSRERMGYYDAFPGSCDNYLFSFSPTQTGFKAVKEIICTGVPFREGRRIYLLAQEK
jgi:hypothetical protein